MLLLLCRFANTGDGYVEAQTLLNASFLIIEQLVSQAFAIRIFVFGLLLSGLHEIPKSSGGPGRWHTLRTDELFLEIRTTQTGTSPSELMC